MTLFLRRTTQFSAGIEGRLDPKLRGGHTYTCSVTVTGSVNPETGVVVNIKDIDRLMKQRIVALYDGTILDVDVPEFQNKPPTVNNLAAAVWRRLIGSSPEGTQLEEVALAQSPTQRANVYSKNRNPAGMLSTTRTYEFSASHRLHSAALSAEENVALFGKCNWDNGHGHNYEVDITVAGELDESGELISGATIDAIVEEEVITPFDHRHLNYDVVEFLQLNPTSENVTRVIWDRMAPRINSLAPSRVRLHRVGVRETPRNYFEYYGD